MRAMARRQGWLSCDRLAIMHALTLFASGTNSEQSRIASGVQAWRASAIRSWAEAVWRPIRSAPTGNANRSARRMVPIWFVPLSRGSSPRRCTLAASWSAVDGSMPIRRAPIHKMTKGTVKRPSARLRQSPCRRPHTAWGGWQDITPRGTFNKGQRLVVELEPAAERSIGHRVDDCAPSRAGATCRCGEQHRVNRDMIDNQGCGDKHAEQSKNNRAGHRPARRSSSYRQPPEERSELVFVLANWSAPMAR